MAKNKMSLRCADLGMDCKFVAMSKDQDKLLKKAEKHLRKKHKIISLTPDMQTKARASIKTMT